jgi:PAS domain S-box-containing protein
MSAIKERSFLTSWVVARPVVAGLIVFLIMQAVVAYIVYQRAMILRENDRREMSNLLHVVYGNVEQSLKNSSTAALTLALTINDEGVPENFELVGKQLTMANPAIDAVQLVPGGVITKIYPLEGHKAALGYDILKSPENGTQARESMLQKKMYFAGPLHLQQGGVGIIGRLPVYQSGRFWGFSGVLIRLENFIRVSGINSIDESKYYFQLSHRNTVTGNLEYFLKNHGDFSDNYYDVVSIPDTDWKLYIISKNDHSEVWVQLIPMATIGTLLALLFGFMVSIILRKPAELQLEVMRQTRRLLNSEIKYKTIFDQAAVGIAHVNSQTTELIDCNEQYSHMLGYSRDELIGKNVNAISHPDDIEAGDDCIRQLKSGEISNFSVEKRYIAKSGNTIWAHVTVSPLGKSGEKPSTQIAIAQDITPRKEAEAQLHETETRFKSLFENSPVALWEEDFSAVKICLAAYQDLTPKNAHSWLIEHPGVVKECISLVRIIDINNECLKLHQPRTKEELLAANLDPLLDDTSSDSFVRQLVAVVHGESFTEMDTQIIDPVIGNKDIYLRWSVMRGYEDTLERVIISTEDITSQKQAERIIRSSQQRIESLIDTIDGIVWECDYNTFEFTFVNKKAEQITGYPVEQWLYNPTFWAEKIHPDDREEAINFCMESSQTKNQYDFEYRMLASNGSVIWMRDIVNVIREDGVPVSLKGIMIDITKTKEAENELNATLELVNEQKKRLMNFSYIVSHNLRSHAANIQSIVSLYDTAESDEERNEFVTMLKTVSRSLNETMVHLHDLVNIQSNVALTSEPLNLRHYAEMALRTLSDQIEGKKASVANNIPENVTVRYNAAYLESVLHNLFSNALRYSHPDRKPLITADWEQQDGKNILKVADNGVGIDMARFGDKLFGMYKTFHGNPEARGIGLFMTKNQVEAMGGTIEVESEAGKGTTFKVSFAS